MSDKIMSLKLKAVHMLHKFDISERIKKNSESCMKW